MQRPQSLPVILSPCPTCPLQFISIDSCMSPDNSATMSASAASASTAASDFPPQKRQKSSFTEVDTLAINTIRLLAADMVQSANSGHPGAPMGCAPLAHVLFTRHLRCNPKDPKWFNRDRFVLSNGHACALQYALLHLLGYPLSKDDLRQFRQLESKTPGHPESHITEGIEVTTGPLGQGFANAVGLAWAQSHLEATYGGDATGADSAAAATDEPLFDNFTYVLLGDGCMQEGVAAEAASLAGHWKLGKLIALYDDNRITIDGDTEVSFTEDVTKRFEAYGFHCLSVEDGDTDLDAIDEAIRQAKAVRDAPTLIRIRTTIGKGSEAVQGTEKAHGAPLGADELRRVKAAFGFDPDSSFVVPESVRALYAAVAERGAEAQAAWQTRLSAHPQRAEIERRFSGALPVDLSSVLPRFDASSANSKPVATRKLSEGVLDVLGPLLPELCGGSADLTASNLTFWKGAVDYQHDRRDGRYLRFGVREHGMLAIVNGVSAYGGFLPFGATFLNFITYGWGAVRLAALSRLRALFIMTHDSIGLGEDGPTHQPVEVLAALRALPNILTIRPADGNEVSGAYWAALRETERPAVLCLSRQNLPQLAGSSPEGVLRGGYVLRDFGSPTRETHSATLRPLILVATGSEVALACAAADLLQGTLDVRVVSLPCWELFREQSQPYRDSVFPARIPVLAVEAASELGWLEWADAVVGMRGFGWSGPYARVYEKVGLEAAAIVKRAIELVENYIG